jgi:hypothetical protein
VKMTKADAAIAEKEKTRTQITAQLNDCLRSGGRVCVLDNRGGAHRSKAGTARRDRGELPEFADHEG